MLKDKNNFEIMNFFFFSLLGRELSDHPRISGFDRSVIRECYAHMLAVSIIMCV